MGGLQPEPTFGDRFAINRQLGRGGMGIVYEAFDRERGQKVALKTLKAQGPAALYRFKQEFRKLSNVVHPNLVTLYELHATDALWFFTMELVDGIGFLDYVRGGNITVDESTTRSTRVLTALTIPATPRGGRTFRMAGPPAEVAGLTSAAPNLERLVPCLRQLAIAIQTLHESGHLHGDINPSNVLVDHGGRVVVLDFGIITELAGGRTEREGEEIVGTPAYMAPEQFLRGHRPSPATDWYALGVILYEALAGRRPYAGGPDEVIAAKLRYDPIPSRGAGALRPIAELCNRLLHREPAERPTGEDIIDVLGRDDATAPSPADASSRDITLLGRDRELAILRDAYRDLKRGLGTAILVSGRSGMGKSALVQEVLDELAEERSTIILAGRCYERESVPYKALDSLVDALYRYLNDQPPDQAAALMPGDTTALVQAFPILAQLQAFAPDLPGDVPIDDDKVGLRRRAFGALRDLLASLARKQPVVMFIDDLQWGDVDSAPFLLELLADTRIPLLFVGSFRVEDKESSRLLRSLTTATHGRGVREIQLGELTQDDLVALASGVLQQVGAPVEGVRRIAQEARGSPFFAYELARHAAARVERDRPAPTLDEVIMERVRTLSPAARRLLDVIAVAGMRMPQLLAERVAEIKPDERRVLLELNAGRFVRTTGARESDTVEVYHDRIRETLLDQLSTIAQREIHARIAHALDAGESIHLDDLYALAHHYFHGHSREQAGRAFALNRLAGETAMASYAYDQAYLYLDQARRIADEGGIGYDAQFEFGFGDACAKTGRVELAAASFQTALAQTREPVFRARLFLGLSKVYLGQLDATRSRDHAAGGLAEIGYKRPGKSVADIARSLWAIWRGWRTLRRGAAGRRLLPSGEQQEQLRVAAELYLQAGSSAYFEMDRLGMVQIVTRLFGVGAQLGPSRPLMEAFVLSSVVAAIRGRPSLSNRFMENALRINDKLRDLGGTARLRQYAGHVANFLGDAPRGATLLRDSLTEYGHFLENMDFLTAVADLAWNLMMRGQLPEAWSWIEHGLQRAALGGEQGGLAHGHTYRCYAGPILAALGRENEGRKHLDEYEEIIVPVPGDRWRWGQYLGHRILYEVELGGLGDELERLIERHTSMRLSPTSLGLSMRHVYVAIAYARLRQCEAAPSKLAMKRLRTALRDLERTAGTHATLCAHLLVVSAGDARLKGHPDQCEQRLATAQRIAEDQDNRWVKFEVALGRSAVAYALGDRAAAERMIEQASAIAVQHGWPKRAERARAARRP